jgi:hypothetical protein
VSITELFLSFFWGVHPRHDGIPRTTKVHAPHIFLSLWRNIVAKQSGTMAPHNVGHIPPVNRNPVKCIGEHCDRSSERDDCEGHFEIQVPDGNHKLSQALSCTDRPRA